MTEPLPTEDRKLVSLARSARARQGTDQGAAVRDADGRTYAAASVSLPSLSLSALQVAVVMAAASGAPGLEAAVIVGEFILGADPMSVDVGGIVAVRDLAPKAVIYLASPDGEVVADDRGD